MSKAVTTGFEPAALRLTTERSDLLSYATMAPAPRLELGTPRLTAAHSAELSYTGS